MGDIIVLSAIGGVCTLAIRSMIKDKKKGGCAGCSRNCGSCGMSCGYTNK